MILGIEKTKAPKWLSKLTNVEQFSIHDVLQGSLYYPASGRDGDPVKYLGGFIHSFIYVDYGIDYDEVKASLHGDEHGFSGYSTLSCRDISERELVPSGWTPKSPDVSDGNLARARRVKTPFAIWSVFERNSDQDESHGPKRFSILYICGDGVATFQAIYLGNQCRPKVIAIIQPGTGFGGNWTDFREPDKIFGRSVLSNPEGKPEYLLYGGWGPDYSKTCWPQYSKLIHYWNAAAGKLGLWQAQ
jgi:hypothetical protein